MSTTSTNLQLYKSGALTASTTRGGSKPMRGRNLVFAEEFDRPVSLSRTGVGADYAAGKPNTDFVDDFGDAIFAGPEDRLGNVRVVDRRYLQMSVHPNPPGYQDPDGYGREYVGGMLASARPGGSGFSAQYGYFESRMLVPANPGTWPAFWLLSNTNLITPQRYVAEIDALEHYGHNPKGTCSTTHQYPDPDSVGIALCKDRWATNRTAVAWHTYGVSVEPDKIRFFIDGRQVETAPQVRGGGSPMFFMVNLALGGGWPVELASTQGRAKLYVDYIHVYV